MLSWAIRRQVEKVTYVLSTLEYEIAVDTCKSPEK
jgi:hypothetical protein